MYPVLGGEVVERQEFVEVVGDFGDGFAEFGAVGQFERRDGPAGVVAVLGVPDLGEGPFRTRVRRLRQRRQHVADLVETSNAGSGWPGRLRAARTRTPAPRRRRRGPGHASRAVRSRAAGPPTTRPTPGSPRPGR